MNDRRSIRRYAAALFLVATFPLTASSCKAQESQIVPTEKQSLDELARQFQKELAFSEQTANNAALAAKDAQQKVDPLEPSSDQAALNQAKHAVNTSATDSTTARQGVSNLVSSFAKLEDAIARSSPPAKPVVNLNGGSAHVVSNLVGGAGSWTMNPKQASTALPYYPQYIYLRHVTMTPPKDPVDEADLTDIPLAVPNNWKVTITFRKSNFSSDDPSKKMYICTLLVNGQCQVNNLPISSYLLVVQDGGRGKIYDKAGQGLAVDYDVTGFCGLCSLNDHNSKCNHISTITIDSDPPVSPKTYYCPEGHCNIYFAATPH